MLNEQEVLGEQSVSIYCRDGKTRKFPASMVYELQNSLEEENISPAKRFQGVVAVDIHGEELRLFVEEAIELKNAKIGSFVLDDKTVWLTEDALSYFTDDLPSALNIFGTWMTRARFISLSIIYIALIAAVPFVLRASWLSSKFESGYILLKADAFALAVVSIFSLLENPPLVLLYSAVVVVGIAYGAVLLLMMAEFKATSCIVLRIEKWKQEFEEHEV
ncbi:hypothetical protein H6770_04465 [Candidatus Peribacteria bacterium]|nr:hypothetical protein [Candidatus Peribacteria bacterium]